MTEEEIKTALVEVEKFHVMLRYAELAYKKACDDLVKEIGQESLTRFLAANTPEV